MNQSLIRDLLKKGQGVLTPPGCFSDFVRHPSKQNKAVEVATVQEHRFAFYYWLRWHFERISSKRKPATMDDPSPPDLLTVDWHDDVGVDDDCNPKNLKRLNPRNSTELGLFCWLGLHRLNDGHILPAAYLNAVGDVHVILKQHALDREEYPEKNVSLFPDRFGYEHVIRYYSSPEEFLEWNENSPHHSTIFDLDLDYFTKYDDDDHPEGFAADLVPDDEIRQLLDPVGEFMQWVKPRLAGMTIALEPEYCGGISNCFHLLNMVSDTLFDPPLFREGCNWRKP